MVKCRSCGFEWASSPAPVLEVGGSNYTHYVRARELKKAHFRRQLGRLGPGRGRRLLDVGCAAGFLLEVAMEAGFDAHGVETSAAFADATTPALAGRVLYRPFETVEFSDPFDVVTMFDVLEHSDEPRALLGKAKALLREGGTLLLQIPCVDSWSRAALGRYWFHYAHGHRAYFTRDTFARLAQDVGFTVRWRAWTRKHMTVDYLASQTALLLFDFERPLHLPLVGRRGVNLPLGEALFELGR